MLYYFLQIFIHGDGLTNHDTNMLWIDGSIARSVNNLPEIIVSIWTELIVTMWCLCVDHPSLSYFCRNNR